VRCRRPEFFSERPFWVALPVDWHPLGDCFGGMGWSFEWHDFEAATRVDWGKSSSLSLFNSSQKTFFISAVIVRQTPWFPNWRKYDIRRSKAGAKVRPKSRGLFSLLF
jgi:hypothetical protein